MRTMIDILKKGNQELFHSTVIAWLLDAEGEHGLGRQFVDGVADQLVIKGDKYFKDMISGKKLQILTESKARNSRYDIEVRVDGGKIVFENKTKSLGGRGQIDQYLNNKVKVVPLGLSEYSFDKSVSKELATLEYSDVYKVLAEISLEKHSDFSVLVKHYKEFLARELSFFDLIKSIYRDGNIDDHYKVNEIANIVTGYTDNDIRFLNLYYFELLKDVALSSSNLSESVWTSNKSMQSGVWLANHKTEPEKHNFSKEMSGLRDEFGARFWLHIELWGGVCVEGLDTKAGMIQLRASCRDDNKALLNRIKSLNLRKESQYYPARTSNKSDTFYCIGEDIQKSDLQFVIMTDKITNFMGQFSA